MENCLVTKLKSVIDNDNLPIFDSIVLKYKQREAPNTNTQFIGIKAKSTGNVILQALDGAYFTSSYGGKNIGNTITVASGTTESIWVSNNTCRVVVKNKQNIYSIQATGVSDLINIDYCNGLESINAPLDLTYPIHATSLKVVKLRTESVGAITNIPVDNLVDFQVPAYISTLDGSINELANALNLETLYINSDPGKTPKIGGNIDTLINTKLRFAIFDKNTNITGSFESLASCLINYINNGEALNQVSYQISGTNISGSVQAFVNACVDGGVTSGTITLPYIKSVANLYEDLEHTTLIKNNGSINNVATTKLTWASDKTWNITNS